MHPKIMTNILVTHTTLRVSKGVQLQQRGYGYKKKLASKEIIMSDYPNNVNAFNGFERKVHVEFQFRLADLTRDNLCNMGVFAINE